MLLLYVNVVLQLSLTLCSSFRMIFVLLRVVPNDDPCRVSFFVMVPEVCASNPSGFLCLIWMNVEDWVVVLTSIRDLRKVNSLSVGSSLRYSALGSIF